MIGRSAVTTRVPARERRPSRRGDLRKRRDFIVLATLLVASAAATGATATGLIRPDAGTPPRSRVAAATRAGGPASVSYGFAWLRRHGQPALDVHAAAAIVVDLDTRTVLWALSPDLRRAPASLTKMVTAMVALDHASPQQVLTVPAAAAAMPPDRMGLGEGDRVTVEDLLYGVFLDSGNDAAETLGTRILPWGRFVQVMNEKVKQLGLTGTRFVNPTGLDAPGHYSTAYDLAVIGGYLEEHYPLLARVAETREKWMSAGPGHKAFDLRTLDKMLAIYPGATGLKTGFTDNAGGCLVATATRGGRHLLAVVLGSDVFFTDATRMLDYGFSVTPTAPGRGPTATP
ncbi:MAG: D-alanyl-D-alanine carboxypeptidase family protein [Candidatus Dormibacterales bacterium]